MMMLRERKEEGLREGEEERFEACEERRMGLMTCSCCFVSHERSSEERTRRIDQSMRLYRYEEERNQGM